MRSTSSGLVLPSASVTRIWCSSSKALLAAAFWVRSRARSSR